MKDDTPDEQLSRAHAMMTGEMEQIRNIGTNLHKTSDTLNRTADTYDEYGSKLGISKRYLREIRTRVKY
jgi:hypothetical protein